MTAHPALKIEDAADVLSEIEVTCPDCRGRGYFWELGPAPAREDCDWCAGSGWVYQEIEL